VKIRSGFPRRGFRGASSFRHFLIFNRFPISTFSGSQVDDFLHTVVSIFDWILANILSTPLIS
jgi:hypothetical protein